MKNEELMMEFGQLERLILDTINNPAGVYYKGTELVLKVMASWHPKEFRSEEYLAIVDMLVQTGQIAEIEFVLPGTDRIKSIYFPKGTSFTLKI